MANYEEEDGPPVALAARSDKPGDSSTSTPKVRTRRIDLAEANPRHRVDYSVSDRDVVMVRPWKSA